MSKPMHGQATIRVNGKVYDTHDDASFMPGGQKNTATMIGKKSHRTQTTIGSKLTCKIGYTSQHELRELQEMNEAEVQFVSDNGRAYAIYDACQTGEIEVTGGESDGTIELTFEGDPAEEIS